MGERGIALRGTLSSPSISRRRISLVLVYNADTGVSLNVCGCILSAKEGPAGRVSARDSAQDAGVGRVDERAGAQQGVRDT